MRQSKRKLCVWILTVLLALSACASGREDAISQSPEETAKTWERVWAQRNAEQGATKTIRLGSSLYAVQIAREFTLLSVSNEDWEDDMVACYHNGNTLLDFAVYQFSKEGYPDTLEEFVKEEAEEYEASEIVTGETVNGISVGIYRSIAEYGSVFRDGLTYVLENNDEYVEIDFWFIGYQAESEAREIVNSLTLIESAPLSLGAYQIQIPKDFTLLSEADANPAVYTSVFDSVRLYVRRFPGAEASLPGFVRAEAARNGGSDIETDAEINGVPVASYRSIEALDGAFHSMLTYVFEDGSGFTALAFRLDSITAEAEAEAILETLNVPN